MTLKITFVLLFAIFTPSLCCKLEKNYNDVYLCESLEELSTAGSHPEWKNLILRNPGNLKKTELKNDAFKDFPNLEILKIVGMVNKLEPKAFQSLTKLSKLHLIDNPIEELPDSIFDPLVSLKVLELHNLGLKKINPGLVHKVEFLSLEGNHINPGTIFKDSNIVNLQLSNNSISKLEDCAFCGMKKLQYLTLHFNQLTSFEPERILGESKELLGVNIDENKLTHIPSFNSYPKLAALSVDNNSIETIEPNSFAKCPNFGLLLVSNNKLKEIPANIFPEFTPEREDPVFLVIHGNQLQCLSQELKDKIKILRRVTVNDNPWKCECLLDVISWTKSKKAYVGCEFPIQNCKVTCIDKDKKQQIIDVDKVYKQ